MLGVARLFMKTQFLELCYAVLIFVCYFMQSATSNDSLVGTFCSKPFDADVDWSLVAKASPVYMTVCILSHSFC